MVVNKIRVAMYTLVWRMNHSCIASVCMNLHVYLLYEGEMISCNLKIEQHMKWICKIKGECDVLFFNIETVFICVTYFEVASKIICKPKTSISLLNFWTCILARHSISYWSAFSNFKSAFAVCRPLHHENISKLISKL